MHNGWHLALYLIEQERFGAVLEQYDRFVAPRIAGDSLLDLVDASALLWRLELAGGNVGDRWGDLARQWMTHVDDHVLVFNDLHIALAVSRAGDAEGVARLTASLDRYAREGRGDNRDITVPIGNDVTSAIWL